ncbi:Uncharacterized protein TCAP_01100 [Tolypocladium capitatum]|uniref:Uncharacterized protein n=1 Tax=Tolypocladium capitatum TaxID=45235 RepID=A0A2K3QN74_9HYPO|nr:Uncharacterized protein TCAP_01100 [Tolypocladium capitatum]
MAGGMGREQLTAFYRDHFIFWYPPRPRRPQSSRRMTYVASNPPDTALQPLSRTIGPDRIVDEFIFTCTHTLPIPWLLPSIPASHRKLQIPMVAVVNVRGDRLCHEHIWWDQATALRQAGVLPTHVASPDGGMVKLPAAGAECARLLVDKRPEGSNEMLDPGWASR